MPRNTVIYEQCPWDRARVLALYRNLSEIVADGEWHQFPEFGDIGVYRVFGATYFQAVFTKRKNKLFEEILNANPPETNDDAEWTLRKDRYVYEVTSKFCLMPTLVDVQSLNSWLDRHGLWLEPEGYSLRGWATFDSLEPGCFLDALERLSWLENINIRVNVLLKKTADVEWDKIRIASEALYDGSQSDENKDEIAPLPEQYMPSGNKRRVPVDTNPLL